MIPNKAVEAIHSAVCEESLEDHMDPDWPGRCVKAAQAAAPYISAATLREATDHIEYGNPVGSWLCERADELEASAG